MNTLYVNLKGRSTCLWPCSIIVCLGDLSLAVSLFLIYGRTDNIKIHMTPGLMTLKHSTHIMYYIMYPLGSDLSDINISLQIFVNSQSINYN